jgi:hypothetical protein
MAIWSESQIIRLATEVAILAVELPHFAFYDRSQAELTTVRGTHTSSGGKTYNLCVRLRSSFPHDLPGLYVTSPSPLYGFGGKTIQSYGTNHDMHVWAPDWNNFVKICHCKSEYWSASNTIVSVIMKGFLWLEAFEAHCRTGRTIDSYSLTYPVR